MGVKRILKRIFILIILACALALVGLVGCTQTPQDRQNIVVDFYNDDGSLLNSVSLTAGEVPNYSQTPQKESAEEGYIYVFEGWQSGGQVYAQLPAVYADTAFTASYKKEAITYTVTFAVGTNNVQAQYTYGQTPTYTGETVITIGGEQYEVIGWDKAFAVVTSNITYTAELQKIIPAQTNVIVTFLVEGEELAFTLTTGTIPRYYGTPFKEGTESCTYTFIGWQNGSEFTSADTPLPAAETDITYIAKFQENKKTFVVNFYDFDYTLLATTTVAYGEQPVYQGETTKEGDEQSSYALAGWDIDGTIYTELPDVTQSVKAVAVWEQQRKTYTLTITYKSEGKVVETYTDVLAYGDSYYVATAARQGLVADRAYVMGVMCGDTQEVVNYATYSLWDGTVATSFLQGSGTKQAPYILSTGAELALLAKNVRAGNTYQNTYFTLHNNIDLNDREWTAIGSFSNPFAGYFDGNEYTISHLSYHSTLTNSNANSGHGFFSTITGTVCNLTVSGTVSSVAKYTGMVVGNIQSESGCVQNCTAYGTVQGYGNVGGVVGINYGTVTNCINYATVSNIESYTCYWFGGVVGNTVGTLSHSKNYGAVRVDKGEGKVGGVVGVVYTATSQVTDCENYGYVQYTKTIGGKITTANTLTYTGGVAGYSLATTTITGCKNFGYVAGADRVGGVLGWTEKTPISSCENRGTVAGTTYVGGITGVEKSDISDCTNYGLVRASAAYCGGIAGAALGNVSGCKNYGNVYSTATSLGGIAGHFTVNTLSVTMQNCQNYGKVISTATSTNAVVGGITGRADSNLDSGLTATVQACFNYGEVIAQGSYVGGVTGICNGATVVASANYATVKNSSGAYVGGIAGSNYGYGFVSNCTNFGTIIGVSSVGEICGQLTSTSKATLNTQNGATMLYK